MNKSLALKLLPGYVLISLLVVYSLKDNLNILAYKPIFNTQEKALQSQRFAHVEEGVPTKIHIPSINVHLDIIEGNYEKTTDSWNVSDKYAQFANVSEPPNNHGANTILYGHNTANVFGNTTKLNPGDRVYVETQKGNLFEYSFIGRETVKPNNVKVFNYKGNSRLTLITCTGLFNEMRSLLYFELVTII